MKLGEKRVAADLSNPEANGAAVAAGYTLIPARGLTPGQRKNAYENELLRTSSQEFPTAGKGAYSDHGTPVDVVPEEKWSQGMRFIASYACFLGRELLGREIEVRVVNCKHFVGKPWGASYAPGHLDFNIWKLGRQWFDHGITVTVDKLLIHEFGHHYAMNHLCDDYHEALCDLGARLKKLAVEKPKRFLTPTAD